VRHSRQCDLDCARPLGSEEDPFPSLSLIIIIIIITTVINAVISFLFNIVTRKRDPLLPSLHPPARARGLAFAATPHNRFHVCVFFSFVSVL